MSQKRYFILFFILFFMVENALCANVTCANINPPDTCMTMLLHSGRKIQVRAVQMSAKIISFRNCENYNRAQAIAIDSILSITDAKGGQFYAAANMKKTQSLYTPKPPPKSHKLSMETSFWHRPWFYIDEEKVSQGEFDAFLWRNLSPENTEYIIKKDKLQRNSLIWNMIGNGTYLLLLIFSLAKLFLFWLIGLPLAITAIIFFRIYEGKVARAYNNIIAAYYKQFK